MSEQQTAPAKACRRSVRWSKSASIHGKLTNLLYRATPDNFCGSAAFAVWTSPSSFVEPVVVAGVDMVARMNVKEWSECASSIESRFEDGPAKVGY